MNFKNHFNCLIKLRKLEVENVPGMSSLLEFPGTKDIEYFQSENLFKDNLFKDSEMNRIKCVFLTHAQFSFKHFYFSSSFVWVCLKDIRKESQTNWHARLILISTTSKENFPKNSTTDSKFPRYDKQLWYRTTFNNRRLEKNDNQRLSCGNLLSIHSPSFTKQLIKSLSGTQNPGP